MFEYWLFVAAVGGSFATHLGYRLWARGADVFRLRALLHASRVIPAGSVLQLHYPAGGTETFVKQNGMEWAEPAAFDRTPNPPLETVADELVDAVNRVTTLCDKRKDGTLWPYEVMAALRNEEL